MYKVKRYEVSMTTCAHCGKPLGYNYSRYHIYCKRCDKKINGNRIMDREDYINEVF